MCAGREKATALRWRSSERHRRAMASQYIRHMRRLNFVRQSVTCDARWPEGLTIHNMVYCPPWSPQASSAKMDRRRRDGEGTQTRGEVVMTFEEVLTQAIVMLQRSGRVSYGA